MGIFSKKEEKSPSAKATEDKKADKKSTKVGSGKDKKKKTSMKDLYGGDTKATKATPKSTVAGKDDKKTIKITGARDAYKVLIKPLITEKATNLASENKYVFEVSQRSNKIQIAKAVLEVYGVKPEAVNIVKVLGKRKRQGRTIGKRKDWKKAVVSLPKGKTINIYEGV